MQGRDAWAGFVLCLFLDFAQVLFTDRVVSRHKVQQGKLFKKATQMKAQASKLNHPDTFASCAKLQRQAATCEREAELIGRKQVSVETSWTARGRLAFRIAAVLVIIYRLSGRAAATLPPDLLWPLNAYFAFPDWSLMGIGGITAFSWLSLCSRATTATAWAVLGS
ncbi:hypothetical protein WJX84_011837 [Apatococcus fuscideae]|uniref:Guided entry of tail-anchored proteins factor 1 n=1 Tax=Apatococcus fuscideae TaxID=2026836 RepID=A0AAW1TH37_9CHLO